MTTATIGTGRLMTWAKIDDKFPHHPRAVEAGPLGRDLYISGLCYAKSHLTDGFIKSQAVSTLAPGNPWRRSAAALVKSGLWESVPGGYRVHDYGQWNDTAEAERARIEAGRERKRRWASRRDGNASNGASGNASGNASGTSPTRARVPTPTPINPLTPLSASVPERVPRAAEVDANGCRWRDGRRIAWPGRDEGARCGHGCPPEDTSHVCVPD